MLFWGNNGIFRLSLMFMSSTSGVSVSSLLGCFLSFSFTSLLISSLVFFYNFIGFFKHKQQVEPLLQFKQHFFGQLQSLVVQSLLSLGLPLYNNHIYHNLSHNYLLLFNYFHLFCLLHLF